MKFDKVIDFDILNNSTTLEIFVSYLFQSTKEYMQNENFKEYTPSVKILEKFSEVFESIKIINYGINYDEHTILDCLSRSATATNITENLKTLIDYYLEFINSSDNTLMVSVKNIKDSEISRYLRIENLSCVIQD